MMKGLASEQLSPGHQEWEANLPRNSSNTSVSEYTGESQISRRQILKLEGTRDCKEERDTCNIVVSWGLAGKPGSVQMKSGISGMNWRKRASPSGFQELSTGRTKAGTWHQQERHKRGPAGPWPQALLWDPSGVLGPQQAWVAVGTAAEGTGSGCSHDGRALPCAQMSPSPNGLSSSCPCCPSLQLVSSLSPAVPIQSLTTVPQSPHPPNYTAARLFPLLPLLPWLFLSCRPHLTTCVKGEMLVGWQHLQCLGHPH